MQLIKSLFLAGLFFFIGQQVFAQSDYVTIVPDGRSPKKAWVTKNGTESKKVKLQRAEGTKNFNLTGVLKLIREYEKKGYKLKDSSTGFFLLVREEDE